MRTYYFHPTVTTQYRGKTVKRRATVAAILKPISEEGTEEAADAVTAHRFCYGLAVCSEKDQFRKKYGREAALGKAWSKAPTTVTGPIDSEVEQKEINKLFLYGAVQLLESQGYEVLPKPPKTPKVPKEVRAI